MSDDRRRKKNWREIDRGKNKSRHRRTERPGTDPYSHRRNTSYKAELNRFFDKGVASDRIKHQIDKAGSDVDLSADVENPERLRLIRRVRAAATFDQFVNAVNELREGEGLPNDADVLIRVLEHPEEPAIRDALQRLLDFPGRFDLTTLKSIRNRLESLDNIANESETLKLMAALRKKLFGGEEEGD